MTKARDLANVRYTKGTTANRPTGNQGDLYYDTSDSRLYQKNSTTWGAVGASTVSSIEVLVVAGGGGSGDATNVGAGGGAGGLVYQASRSVAGTFTVTVGSGGAKDASGANSVFGTITANGGGRGGDETTVGANGGSGGGSTWASGFNTPGTATQTDSGGGLGYGNAGGNNPSVYSNVYPSGGGGGAGAAGQAGQPTRGGNGGDGRAYSINGTSTYYAGGGGGGSWIGSSTYSSGGLGGGGRGGANISGGDNPAAGTVNTGGGGGGNGSGATSGTGGGSGIIIVAYPDSYSPLSVIDAGLTYTVSTTARAGYRVYTFTGGTGSVTI